jgi:hypothetical protein
LQGTFEKIRFQNFLAEHALQLRSDRIRPPCASGHIVAAAGFLMSDRWPKADPQTAFPQADEELRPKTRSQSKNASAMLAQLEMQSIGGVTKPSSENPICPACHTSDSQKSIQSP